MKVNWRGDFEGNDDPVSAIGENSMIDESQHIGTSPVSPVEMCDVIAKDT